MPLGLGYIHCQLHLLLLFFSDLIVSGYLLGQMAWYQVALTPEELKISRSNLVKAFASFRLA